MIEPSGTINALNAVNTYRDSSKVVRAPRSSMEIADEAIISEKAKILNKLEEYQTGKIDELDLAISTELSKHSIEANIRVFDTANEVMKETVNLGEDVDQE